MGLATSTVHNNKQVESLLFIIMYSWLSLSAQKYYPISAIEISAKCHIGATPGYGAICICGSYHHVKS